MIFIVDIYASLEKELVSVERVVQYTDLPSEAAEILDQRPPKFWPSGGAIEVQGLKVRYADELPMVLDDVSFSVPAGTKVSACTADYIDHTLTCALAAWRVRGHRQRQEHPDAVHVSLRRGSGRQHQD